MTAPIFVALLHENMVDKTGKEVTTSLTLNDVQDLARSCKTYGVQTLYIVHPAAAMRKLAKRLMTHWISGYGSTYNEDRKNAIASVEIVSSLDEVIMSIETQTKSLPHLVATSAHEGPSRTPFKTFSQSIQSSKESFLIMLGTGWGMNTNLLERAETTLEPINGPTPYNHLSVRSACAIILDKILGRVS